MNNISQGATALSVASAKHAICNKQKDLFIPLGFSNSNYYFFSLVLNLTVKIKAGQFKPPYMFKLAPLNWWQENYKTNDRRSNTGVSWALVANDLMSQCHNKGNFQGAVAAKDIPALKWLRA